MKNKLTLLLLGMTAYACIFSTGFSISSVASNKGEFIPEVHSNKYLVDNTSDTISEIPPLESLADFYDNIELPEGFIAEVMQSDGITPAQDLQTGYKLILRSEDNSSSRIYILILDKVPEDIFFSEYIEGNSNNKAIEIFNPNAEFVKLKYYRIVQSVNGGGWRDFHIFPAGAVIEPGGVWVIINNKTSEDLFAFENASEVEKSTGLMGFNGNDARGLIKLTGNDTIIVDVIGVPDEDPGNGWNVAGIKNATQNKTLIRKPRIFKGNSDWLSSAGTNEENSEWIVMPVDYFSDLGMHTFSPVKLVEQIMFPGNENPLYIIYPGDSIEILYEVLPEDAYNKAIFWTSSDTSIAIVTQTGKVIARNNGTVLINASAMDQSGVDNEHTVIVSGQNEVSDGIKEYSNTKRSFTVYPNPVIDKLIIENPDVISHITVTSISGRVVLKTVAEEQRTILDMSDLKEGVYILSIYNGRGRNVVRLIKRQ